MFNFDVTTIIIGFFYFYILNLSSDLYQIQDRSIEANDNQDCHILDSLAGFTIQNTQIFT